MLIKSDITKQMDLVEAIRCVLGSYRPMFSKGLAPPMVVFNGQIYVGSKIVMEGDIDILRFNKQLSMVARSFGVVLELRSEKCGTTLWRSDHEDEWFGRCVDESGNDVDAPQDFSVVRHFYEKEAALHQKRWCVAHGITPLVRKRKKKNRHRRKV